jgi:DNA-binding MarR family transcriptional regulator
MRKKQTNNQDIAETIINMKSDVSKILKRELKKKGYIMVRPIEATEVNWTVEVKTSSGDIK